MDTQSGPSSAPKTENDPPTSASRGATARHATGPNEADRAFTSPEQEARVKEFFQYWKVPSEDLTRCPPEMVLLDAAKKPNPSDWPEHIQHCSACRELVHLIAKPATERMPARAILAEAGRRAWLAEHGTPRHRFTPQRYLQVFFNSLGQAQRTAVAAVFIFTLVLASWFTYKWWQSPPPNVVKLDVEYWKAVEWFDRANLILADEGLKSHQKVADLQALKSQKAEIESITNNLPLDDTQRAELATRKATYNNQTMILTAALQMNNPKPEDLPFEQTQDSKIVTQVWAAFGSLDGKTITLGRQDPETAKALLEAAEYIDITKITQGDDSKPTVTVSFLDTSLDKSKPEVQQSINLLESSGVHVDVVKFNESSRPFKARKATKFQSGTPQ